MAYGARLESELGESPQGFKSPILRHKKRTPFRVFFSYSRGIRIWEELAPASDGSPILRCKTKRPERGVLSLQR